MLAMAAQPAITVQPQFSVAQQPGHWQTGLMDCCSDCGVCEYTVPLIPAAARGVLLVLTLLLLQRYPCCKPCCCGYSTASCLMSRATAPGCFFPLSFCSPQPSPCLSVPQVCVGPSASPA